MGMERLIQGRNDCDLARVLALLGERGQPSTVIMVDGALHAPGAPVPAGWRDARLKTPGGTVSLKRRPDGIAVVVFGNADAALKAAQEAVALAVEQA